MTDDPRCCGSGTCIIDADGRCWCGQQWNGEAMCHPAEPAPGGANANADARPAEGAAAQDGGSRA